MSSLEDVLKEGDALLEKLYAADAARAAKRTGSGFVLKEMGNGTLTLTGVASSNTVDRVGDVVEPSGAVLALPVPFLLGHDHAHPLGQVTTATKRGNSIEIVATLYKGVSPRIDEAIRLIQLGLYPGLSIGFRGLKSERMGGTSPGIRFTEWELLEVSAVTVPANPDGKITGAKRYTYAATKAVRGGLYTKDWARVETPANANVGHIVDAMLSHTTEAMVQQAVAKLTAVGVPLSRVLAAGPALQRQIATVVERTQRADYEAQVRARDSTQH